MKKNIADMLMGRYFSKSIKKSNGFIKQINGNAQLRPLETGASRSILFNVNALASANAALTVIYSIVGGHNIIIITNY